MYLSLFVDTIIAAVKPKPPLVKILMMRMMMIWFVLISQFRTEKANVNFNFII